MQLARVQLRWGQRNLVMELVNIYHVLSCSFVEIMRSFVVSVCINLSYGIVGMTWRSFVLAAYCVAHAKPCMLCFVKACVLELVIWVILYTSTVAFVNDCNKEHHHHQNITIIIIIIITCLRHQQIIINRVIWQVQPPVRCCLSALPGSLIRRRYVLSNLQQIHATSFVNPKRLDLPQWPCLTGNISGWAGTLHKNGMDYGQLQSPLQSLTSGTSLTNLSEVTLEKGWLTEPERTVTDDNCIQ